MKFSQKWIERLVHQKQKNLSLLKPNKKNKKSRHFFLLNIIMHGFAEMKSIARNNQLPKYRKGNCIIILNWKN